MAHGRASGKKLEDNRGIISSHKKAQNSQNYFLCLLCLFVANPFEVYGTCGFSNGFCSGVRLFRKASSCDRSSALSVLGFNFSSRFGFLIPPFRTKSTTSSSFWARPSWKYGGCSVTLRKVGVLKAPFKVSASGSFFPAFSAASPRILPRPRSGMGLSKPMPTLWNRVSVKSGGRWHSVQLALSELLKTSKPLTTSSFTADLSPA